LDSKKLIAAVVVALFCVTAYAYVDVGDEADAASNTYEVYVEVINANGHVAKTAYVYFESEADNAKFCEAATKAFADAGLAKLEMIYNLEKGSISVKYDGSGNSATYVSDGKQWVAVADTTKDYINSNKIGLAVGTGYISEEVYDSLPLVEQVYWQETGWGAGTDWAYMKVLEVNGSYGKIMDYKVNMTMIDDDLIKTSSDSFKFTCENEPSAWCYALNEAVKGNSIFSKVSASYAAGFISILFGDSMNNATYVKTDGKWVSVEDTAKSYLSGSDLDFELKNGYISKEKFDKLSSSEQKNWQETGMGYGFDYMRLPPSSSGDNTMMYIIIAVVVIVVIAAAAFFFMKKKQTA